MSCDCWEHKRLGPQPPNPEQMKKDMDRIVRILLEKKEEDKMGTFNINITGVGGHGCERKAKTGEKLYGRCGRFGCPDCMAYEFVQQLKQKGMLNQSDASALFTHWPGQTSEVVDNLLTNERLKGQF